MKEENFLTHLRNAERIACLQISLNSALQLNSEFSLQDEISSTKWTSGRSLFLRPKIVLYAIGKHLKRTSYERTPLSSIAFWFNTLFS